MKKSIYIACIALGIGFWLTWPTLSQVQNEGDSAVEWTHENIGRQLAQGNARVVGQYIEVPGIKPVPSVTRDSVSFVSTPRTGDVVIVAHVLDVGCTNRAAKAGVMFRNSNRAGASMISLAMSSSNEIVFQYRDKPDVQRQNISFNTVPLPGGGARVSGDRALRNWSEVSPGPAVGLPCWLMLVRKGENITGYYSAEGTNWTWVGTARVLLNPRIFAGLSMSGGDELCAARFEKVDVREVASAPTQSINGTGTGLRVTFTDSSGSTVQNATPKVNSTWKYLEAPAGLRHGPFNAVWEGSLQAQYTEPYSIQLTHDQVARLWLDDQLVFDDAAATNTRTVSAIRNLTAGTNYPVRLEYHQPIGNGSIHLEWMSPSTPLQTIPTSQLYPPQLEAGMELSGAFQDSYSYDLTGGLEALEQTDKSPDLLHPWLGRSLGGQLVAGRARQLSSQKMVVASGGRIGGDLPDAGRFVYQPWSGDVEMIVRVQGSFPANTLAKAGLMIRESLKDDARMAFLAIGAQGSPRLLRRSQPSKDVEPLRIQSAKADWIKLTRRGQHFAAFGSPDGVNWQLIGTTTIPIHKECFIGVGVSGTAKKVCEATFDGLQINAAPVSEPLVGVGDGVLAVYSNEGTSNTVERMEPRINFAWRGRSPAEGISAESFRATWTSQLEAPLSEVYTFTLFAQQPTKVWLDGKLVASSDTEKGVRIRSEKIQLRAGHRYSLKVECAEQKGRAMVRLWWSSPSTRAQPVSQFHLYSPNHPEYQKAPDLDQDGMPDSWERLHSLDPENPADGAQDLDGDGVTNYNEFRLGSNPRNPDTDGDSIPDGWEISYGLDPLDPANASADTDRDGLTDSQEFREGTNPGKFDSDQDGFSDYDELNELGTNPLIAQVHAIQTVFETTGASAAGSGGKWKVEGTSMISDGKRGWLDYLIQIPADGMYRLEVHGSSANDSDANKEFELVLSVDGEQLGRAIMLSTGASAGVVHQLTPWLTAGDHLFRIYWDNAYPARWFRLNAVKVQAFIGSDANGNGIQDWAESRLLFTCSAQVPSSSAVSPVSITGRAKYLTMMQVLPNASAEHGPNDTWYADVPLSATNATTIMCSFQNGGLVTTNRITWMTTDVLTASDMIIRRGDALLLTAQPPEAKKGQVTIAISGMTNYTLQLGQAAAHKFTQDGVFQVTGTYKAQNGQQTTKTMTVTVVSVDFGAPLAAWEGKWREFNCNLPTGVSLHFDSRLGVRTNSVQLAGDRYEIAVDAPEDRYALARIGLEGPVVAAQKIEGFRLFSAYETKIYRVERYSDDSSRLEMGVILSPLRQQVSVQVDVHVAGVLFEDGTTSLTLTQVDFDETGEARVCLLQPAGAKTSVCHQTKAFQTTQFLGIYP